MSAHSGGTRGLRWSTVLSGLAFVVLLGGCDRPASSTTSQPAAGVASPNQPELPDRVVHPEVDPQERSASPLRIVSTAPTVTELCCALGLRESLVGRTRYCTHPPDILDVPSIGGLNDLSTEVVLSLKPDLVLISGASRQTTDRLTALGLRCESLPDRTLDDLFTAITRLGKLVGRPRTAERLGEAIRGDLDRVDALHRGERKRRVLLLLGVLSDPPRPPFVVAPGLFYDDLLRRAGHTNVADLGGAIYGALSLEVIAQADPDVIVELAPDAASRGQGDADALAVWRKVPGSLHAVAERRIRVLIGPEHYLLGPRLARTYDALCRCIAGEPHE